MKDKIFTDLEKAYNKLFQAHHLNYHWLKRYGPNAFEDDGTLLCMIDGVERTLDGRLFILKTLAYFEIQDQPVFYRWCSIIMRVLNDYDIRFKITAEQKARSEESVREYKSTERDRKKSVEEILSIGRKNNG